MTIIDPSSGEGATPAPETPVTGSPAPDSATPQKPPVSSGETDTRLAELERALKNATEERDRHRKRLSSYEEAEKKAQEQSLTEIERIKKQHADLQSQHEAYVRTTQERLVRYAVEEAARSLNIIDPDAAARLLDWSALEYADDGTPTNAADLLKQLLKHKPYLVAAPPPPSPTPEPPATTSGRPAPPAVPAMNPGRSAIPAPGTPVPGRLPPRLSDPGVLVPPRTPAKYQP